MEDSVIMQLNTVVMFIGLVSMIGAGILSAYMFSKLHEIKKSILLYLPISAVIAIIITILGIPLIISAGMIGVGFVALIYASNHLFYK